MNDVLTIVTDKGICIPDFPDKNHIADREPDKGHLYIISALELRNHIQWYDTSSKYDIYRARIKEWIHCKWYHFSCLIGINKSLVITNSKYLR
jgi:hypothetical protein